MFLPSGDKLPLLFGIAVFGIVGVLMLWGAWYFSQETRAFLPTAAHATGKVIGLKEETSKDSDGRETISYYPTIEFSTPDNRKIRFKSTLAVDQYKYPVGENIKILYNKSNPDDARIDSFDSLWGSTVVLTVMGIAFVGGALLVYFILYREVEVDTALFVAAGFAFAVVLLYAGGWWLSRDSIYLVKHGVRTTGTVIDFNPAPLVEFKTPDDKIIKLQSHISTTPPKYSQGDKVSVLYDPDEPSRASIDAFDELWMVTSMFWGLGTVFLLGCIYAVYIWIRSGS